MRIKVLSFIFLIIFPIKNLLAGGDSLELNQKIDSLKIVSQIDTTFYSESVSVYNNTDEYQIYTVLKGPLLLGGRVSVEYNHIDFSSIKIVLKNYTYYMGFTNYDVGWLIEDFYEKTNVILDSSLVINFLKVHLEQLPLNERILYKLGFKPISEYEINDIFENNKDGWSYFYMRYPYANGINEFSRIGFSPDSLQALVYMGTQRHYLSGGGNIVLLRKVNGFWTVIAICHTWVS